MPSVEGVDDDSPAKGFGVHGKSDTAKGVFGESDIGGYGVFGKSTAVVDEDTGIAKGEGVFGESDRNIGVHGKSDTATGVFGESSGVSGEGVPFGVRGKSDDATGVRGESSTGTGVSANSDTGSGVVSFSNSSTGVVGGSIKGDGVVGGSSNGDGVSGYSDSGDGVSGESKWEPPSWSLPFGCHNEYGGVGVRGHSASNIGVFGHSENCVGVFGKNVSGTGILGESFSGDGAVGNSTFGAGVSGSSYKYGVFGRGFSFMGSEGHGVHGESSEGHGVHGYTDYDVGVYGECNENYGGWAARFKGRVDIPQIGSGVYISRDLSVGGSVDIRGNLSKSGGLFKIDHPLDPANKYLCHSFVESPDMKNVYDGVVALDNKGEAEIELPDWFGALNKDFRYQLTAIGAPGPNLYIAEEISDTTTDYSSSSNNNNNSRFKIAGGTSGMKVSWQVTGIRKDPWANTNRIQVEEDKPDKERGYYIYPDLYGQPAENGISRLLFPERDKKELLISENKPY